MAATVYGQSVTVRRAVNVTGSSYISGKNTGKGRKQRHPKGIKQFCPSLATPQRQGKKKNILLQSATGMNRSVRLP
ncbi:MAG: hypothetical protein LBR08_12815 [Bacteroidales bacterium]|jgi:hypothetical protein|nr:hypothetical protein [Bacteroidales bacterium]